MICLVSVLISRPTSKETINKLYHLVSTFVTDYKRTRSPSHYISTEYQCQNLQYHALVCLYQIILIFGNVDRIVMKLFPKITLFIVANEVCLVISLNTVTVILLHWNMLLNLCKDQDITECLTLTMVDAQ